MQVAPTSHVLTKTRSQSALETMRQPPSSEEDNSHSSGGDSPSKHSDTEPLSEEVTVSKRENFELSPPKQDVLSMAKAPVVVVKQTEKVKPYNGSSSHRAYRYYFERICKINNWETNAEKAQHLSVALEGPAVELFKEISESQYGTLMNRSGQPLLVVLAT